MAPGFKSKERVIWPGADSHSQSLGNGDTARPGLCPPHPLPLFSPALLASAPCGLFLSLPVCLSGFLYWCQPCCFFLSLSYSFCLSICAPSPVSLSLSLSDFLSISLLIICPTLPLPLSLPAPLPPFPSLFLWLSVSWSPSSSVSSPPSWPLRRVICGIMPSPEGRSGRPAGISTHCHQPVTSVFGMETAGLRKCKELQSQERGHLSCG